MFTILLGAFTLVLFIYLLLVRRSVVIPSHVNKNRYWFYPLIALLIGVSGFAGLTDLDGRLQTVFAALVVLSFLMDKKGLSESSIVMFSLDNRGIPYASIEKIVLLVEENQPIKMNFFRNGRRGPAMSFDRSLEELAVFLTAHLNDGSKLEIIIKED
ncbi:hypothetical protein [Candidatus Enterococcus moelleringii]|uniref:hypothetical protein n=1 Tax=Candidatus Enterococcus moelleringii TaxID=2815325 RepID=UPI00325A6CAE